MVCSQETAAHGTGTGGPVRYNPCQRAPGYKRLLDQGVIRSENGYYVNPPRTDRSLTAYCFPYADFLFASGHIFRKIN